ncbi:hypothetical protein [Methylobacterium hispanicum]|uniref:hypothetical protein n=1 Tax=Methylobacterium hispanicum TaxID=270350 RepID=UPI002F35CA8D
MTALGDLFPEADAAVADLAASAVTADSRRAGPGAVFVAVPGTKAARCRASARRSRRPNGRARGSRSGRSGRGICRGRSVRRGWPW